MSEFPSLYLLAVRKWQRCVKARRLEHVSDEVAREEFERMGREADADYQLLPHLLAPRSRMIN